MKSNILKYTIKTEFYKGYETKEWIEKEAKKGTIKAKIDHEKANKRSIGNKKKREPIKETKSKKGRK